MLSRKDTKVIKGIAILLMLMHHLYAFDDRIPYDMKVATKIFISGKEFTELIGEFGGICVSIYMFLGGYGLFFSCATSLEKDFQIKNILFVKIVNLYIAYWKVFLIFVPIGYIFFSDQPQYCENLDKCIRYSDFSWNTIIMNFVGLSTSLNGEWWFLFAYFFALFEGFVFIELFRNKHNMYQEIFFVILWNILLMRVFSVVTNHFFFEELKNDFWYSNLFMIDRRMVNLLIGVVFAKYDVFSSWKERIKNDGNRIYFLGVFFLIIYISVFYATRTLDILFVPILIFISIIFIEKRFLLKKFLEILGTHSTNMWLVHSFYCYYFCFFVKMVYQSSNAIISMITLTFLSSGTSILLNYFWKKMGSLKMIF